MIGLALALIVVAIVFSLLGLIWVGIPLGALALILLAGLLVRSGRRTTAREP
jgi:hypothetical protein